MAGRYSLGPVVAISIAFLCGGCGLYLHNDTYQQQATAAQSDFGKVDLSKSFSEQAAKLSSFEADEYLAVASYAVADRDRVLQDLIALPSWVDPKAISGPTSLHALIAEELQAVIGKRHLSS